MTENVERDLLDAPYLTALIYSAAGCLAYPHVTPATAVPASVDPECLRDILCNAAGSGLWKLEAVARAYGGTVPGMDRVKLAPGTVARAIGGSIEETPEAIDAPLRKVKIEDEALRAEIRDVVKSNGPDCAFQGARIPGQPARTAAA